MEERVLSVAAARGARSGRLIGSQNLCWDRRLIWRVLERGLQEGGREGLEDKVALVIHGPIRVS